MLRGRRGGILGLGVSIVLELGVMFGGGGGRGGRVERIESGRREGASAGNWEGGVHKNGIPMMTFAMRNAVGPYNPFALSLTIEERSSRYAGIYATA